MPLNREYVMLAGMFNPDMHSIAHWYMSRKLDGQRCFWDGGISTGQPKRNVPWANNNKDGRYKEPPVATGLWSRYGNVIHAPQWFINQLPKGVMLDGELYLGIGRFQETRTIVSTIEPGSGWSDITFNVFDMPCANVFFQKGQIKKPNCNMFFVEEDCWRFYHESPFAIEKDFLDQEKSAHLVYRFDETLNRMARFAATKPEGYGKVWKFVGQHKLPGVDNQAKELVYEYLEKETKAGGEGLMLRAPSALWVPNRISQLLKVKKFDTDEAVVMGFVNGFGKYRGAMGALVISYNGKEFQLSGFTDEERQYDSDAAYKYAYEKPGELMIGPHNAKHFKRGQTVKFRYRTLTDDGLPREARYCRD